MTSQIEEIKDRLDVAKVISEYIKLKKVGANYRALCPFHSEKNPSFYISPARQIWHCFGCGKGGDIFRFIMEIEGIEFREALETLAKKAGVEIKKEPLRKRTERQRSLDICEIGAKFFEKQLQETKTGKKIKEYLLSRKISQDSIERWRIGYAPGTWRGLSDFLVSKGYKREETLRAGLTITSEDKPGSTPYDRFRGRIIFPIFNLQNQVTGFGGRTIQDIEKENISGKKFSDVNRSESKYINTPNTLVYDKSRILYGLNTTKMEIRKKNSCILVEGYIDVILSFQTGVKNIVATSGTALTPYQLKILSRYTKNLILGFDMDIAGEAATKRGIDTAQVQGFNVKIISLPDEKDPADIISMDPLRWKTLIEDAQGIVDFYFHQSFQRFDEKTLDGKKEISNLLLPFIYRIQNKIEQAHWIIELAKRFRVKEESVWEEIKRMAENQKNIIKTSEALEIPGDIKHKTQCRLTEERFLMLLLKFPDRITEDRKIPQISFKEGRELYRFIKGRKKPTEELNNFISLLELQFEFEKEKGDIDPEEEIQFCIDSLQKLSRDQKIKKISDEIKEIESMGDKKKILKLLKKLSEI